MKKVNVKFGVALAIMSLLTMVALFFEVLSVVMLTVSISLAAFIAFVAMMNVYHYNGYGYNVGQFWFGYSAVGGVIIIALLYATGMHLINDHLAISLIMGLFPVLIPVIGIFLGDCGRVLIKSEPSAI